MPLIKQGKFKEYYTKASTVKNICEQCHEKYFDEFDNYDCLYDVFSDFFYSVDDVYCEARDTKQGLESLLEFSEQKTKESVDRCKIHIREMEEVMHQCIQDFKSVYDAHNGDFSDMEQNTFANYEIYKEI